MEGKIRYKKEFLIFNHEDAGFGTGQEPSGYVKLEIIEGSGKLSAQVQNLKEDHSKFNYKLYILGNDNNGICPVYAGTIDVKKDRGELQWKFNPESVGMTGISIEHFNIAALLVEYKNRENTEVICPLAAYKDKKVEWRSKVGDVIYHTGNRAADLEEEVLKKQNIPNKPAFVGIPRDGIEAPARVEDEIDEEVIAGIVGIADSRENEKIDFYVQEECSNDAEIVEDEEPETNEQENDDEEEVMEADTDEPDGINSGKVFWNPHKGEETQEKNEEDIKGIENINESREKATVKCAFKSKGLCDILAGNENYNPCAHCQSFNNAKKETQKEPKKPENPTASLAKLREGMNKLFEKSDPFHSNRRDYEWWKVNSPVHLNNILYQCNIKTPLLFNPAVMMAHFKYRHLITGIYTNVMRRKEYIVCGVPGVYGKEERPFGDMCIWVQVEGNRPRQGVFGYWLVYVDPRTGKILSMN